MDAPQGAGPAGPGAFIALDFDGTVTLTDTVNEILARWAEPAWLEVEEAWIAGRFGSRECLARQTELLRITPEALNAHLDAVAVDPGAAGLIAAAAERGLGLAVVSDGWDVCVRRILERIGAGATPVIANRLVWDGADRWRAEFPHAAAGCGYGVCKCRAGAPATLRAHVGDGRSDFCAADHADVVFAKGALLADRRRRGAPCVPFVRLEEVAAQLGELETLAAGGATGRVRRRR